MDRYFIELTSRLLKLGLKTVCEENEKQLTVIHQGKELCRVDDENGMSHFPLNITTAEKENLLDKVRDLSSDVADYVGAFQNSKPLTAPLYVWSIIGM